MLKVTRVTGAIVKKTRENKGIWQKVTGAVTGALDKLLVHFAGLLLVLNGGFWVVFPMFHLNEFVFTLENDLFSGGRRKGRNDLFLGESK